MTQFKRWLYLKFLPDWCREGLLEANAHLTQVVLDQKIEIDRLNAYINGLENGIRSQRRITIRNEVGR